LREAPLIGPREKSKTVKILANTENMLPLENPATDKSRLTQAVGEITGRLWCGYHQGFAAANQGNFVERNGKRWMCFQCMVRRGIDIT